MQGAGCGLKGLADGCGGGLGDGVAFAADQKGGGMNLAHMGAGGKGVQAADAVDKALILKELQRAVGNGRLVAIACGDKAFQHFVGAKGAVAFQQNLQGVAADRGQALTRGGQTLFGAGHGIHRAGRMVVGRKGKVGIGHGRVRCYSVTIWLTCYTVTHYLTRTDKERRYPMRFAVMVALGLASPAWAEVPRVVTDFGPVQSLVMEVMGEVGTPVALLPQGGDPHDFQLRPSQAALLADADLVFWDGPELIPALSDPLVALAGQARVVGLLREGGGLLREFADGAVDPHAWLDPANGVAWLGTIAAELSAVDPEHGAIYTANAKAAQTRLAGLDAALAALLAPVRDKPFVVYHDALGYFTDHYGLNVVGAIELSDASSPSAAQLAMIQALLASGGAVCVFPEVGRDPKFISALTVGQTAEQTVRIGAAQDIEFLDMQAGVGKYGQMLRAIAEGMAACLQQD